MCLNQFAIRSHHISLKLYIIISICSHIPSRTDPHGLISILEKCCPIFHVRSPRCAGKPPIA